jgi:adenosine deaminase
VPEGDRLIGAERAAYTPRVSDAAAYDAIPKVELHCHVEGTVRPATVVELARKNGQALPTEDPTELYRYDSLDGFLAIFWMVQELLADPDDWARIAHEAIVDAVPHGLRYRETFFTPARHLAAGQTLGDIVGGLSRGIDAAEREAGARCMLVCDIDRAYGGAAALELVETLAELRRGGGAERVIGVGMDSTELGVDPREFTAAFDLARRAGLRLTGHAGEDAGVGPESIVATLEATGIERIDHGVAIVEDPALAARVAEARIPLTVCPSSNVVVANRFPSLAAHPFRQMREAGLLLTINTDDPAMTGADLGTEYRALADALGFDFADMCTIAFDGIESTWLDDGERASLRASFEREIAAIPRA